MRARLIAFTAVVTSFSGIAQEQYGMAHSNHAGLDAATLNPARPAGQWPYADIRFAGADLFAWNSVVAYGSRDQRLIGELRSGFAGAVDGVVVQRAGVENHRAFVAADVEGPGASIALGRGAISAGVRFRSAVSAVGVSQVLGNFIHHGFGFRPQHGARYQEGPMRAIGMAWSEFNLGCARILHARGFSLLSAGATVKYGVGHTAAGLRIEAMDYTVVDTARVEIHEATATYGFAMPALRAGSGFGADLGVVYERTRSEADGYMPHRSSSGCDPIRYRYRIGASLIDLGGLRFKDAAGGVIRAGALSIADYASTTIGGIEGADSLLASSTEWRGSKGLVVGLPSAASVQIDYAVAERAYVAFGMVQQVSSSHGMRLRRPNSMALTPRFETRYFEAAMPFLVREYEFARPSVGLMLRFDGLVFGTDNLLPFVSKRDVHSVDLYFRVRWMIARSPFCKGKRAGRGAHRTGSREMLPCSVPNG
jgi:hypothetical protein